jgi:hypothetical protein
MKISFEEPIQWKYISYIFIAICFVLSMWIAGNRLYYYRDIKYDKLSVSYQYQIKISDNLALSLSNIVKQLHTTKIVDEKFVSHMNLVLKQNGFEKYVITIPENPTPSKQ